MATERTALRPVAAGHSFADDGYRRGACGVALPELTSGNQARTDRFEEMRCDDFESSRRFLSGYCRRVSLRLKKYIRTAALDARRLYARNTFDFADEIPA